MLRPLSQWINRHFLILAVLFFARIKPHISLGLGIIMFGRG